MAALFVRLTDFATRLGSQRTPNTVRAYADRILSANCQVATIDAIAVESYRTISSRSIDTARVKAGGRQYRGRAVSPSDCVATRRTVGWQNGVEGYIDRMTIVPELTAVSLMANANTKELTVHARPT